MKGKHDVKNIEALGGSVHMGVLTPGL